MMAELTFLQAGARVESSFWGILVPAFIFLFSFVVAYALYRKFSRH